MRVAVIQSNYLPWKGYFDIIHDVDTFIFYDDLQYTKNDWRNRNLIKTASGPQWLTIPVGSRAGRLICEVNLPDPSWQRVHWERLRQSYQRAPHFKRYATLLEDIYLGRRWDNLSVLNQYLIQLIATDLLGIRSSFMDSRQLAPEGRKLDRLIDLLKKAGATHYVSGPSARDYIDPVQFEQARIALEFKDYRGYPSYDQIHPPFSHQVSVLDLLFHQGPDAPWYIWGWRGN